MNHETSQYLHQRDLEPKRGQRKTKEQNEPMTETRAQRRSRRYSDSVRAEMDVSLSESTKRIRTCGSSFLLRTLQWLQTDRVFGQMLTGLKIVWGFSTENFFPVWKSIKTNRMQATSPKGRLFGIHREYTYERKQGHNISLLHMTIDSTLTAFEQSAAFVAGGVFYKVRSRTWLHAASRSYQHQEAHKYFHFKD